MPDDRTLDYYKTNAKKVFATYRGASIGVAQWFKESFPAGGKILDIGTGSARDLIALLDQKFDAYGVEPCEELIKLTLESDTGTKHSHNLKDRITQGALPDLQGFEAGSFDGVLCSAVLMHVPDEDIFNAAYAIRGLLKRGGRLLFSVPRNRNDLDESGERDSKGRLMLMRSSGELALLFERLGFRVIKVWESHDSTGRDLVWESVLLQYDYFDSSRPIDQIESVMNRDKKTATYKLALFRALCDIAIEHYNRAIWVDRYRVGIPMEDIVLKWIVYYWPLFADKRFIPQKNGEKDEPGVKGVKFRSELNSLIAEYQHTGLAGFLIDMSGESFSPEVKKVFKKAVSTIRTTIIKGPVEHAGENIFSYKKENRLLEMPALIWRELCLMSHWIRDALIMRWAELTERMSKGEIKLSYVVDLLLTRPEPERITTVSRAYLDKKGELLDIWTGRKLTAKYHVDHVVPYSLWRNNDLWNLLPASEKVNSSKSDKLPTKQLLIRQKELFIDYWHFLKEQSPNRFLREVSQFTGRHLAPDNWESALFTTMLEGIEFTAFQRGVERWDGEKKG